jgi:hypothetical protein
MSHPSLEQFAKKNGIIYKKHHYHDNFIYVLSSQKKKSRRPVKAALAAASEHLAGLLPLHLVYSQAHETAIEVCHML